MTDAEYAVTKTRLDTLAALWIPCLGLGSPWDITLHYYRDSGEYGEKNKELATVVPQGYQSFAHTSVSWAYMSAEIYINLGYFVGLEEEEQEKIFVHEACHILVHEMRAATRCNCEEYDMRHEERVCTMLAAAFLRSKTYWQDKEEAIDDAN